MQELSCKMGQPGNLIQWTGTTRGYGFYHSQQLAVPFVLQGIMYSG
jgi:hypothetical protein